MERQVVIIGAGPGGLASAMLLALTGAKVTVLERMDRVGGRSAGFAMDGFRFDSGPTFFLYPRILEEIFAACGRRLAEEVDLIRLDPLYRLVFEGGGELRTHAEMGALMEEIGKLNPRDAGGLPRFLAENRKKMELFRPVLESDFSSPRALASLPMLKALGKLNPHRSVDRELSRFFEDPRVRLAFSFQSKYLGMSPFRCPSLFTILSFLEHEHGVFHPRGGTEAVMTAMRRVAEDMGVTVRLNETVRHIRFQGRRAVGVRTEAGDYPADALVINADFARAMSALVPDDLRRRWSDARIATKKFSCSTFMLYLGIEGTVDGLDHHTVYLAEDYARNLAEIEECRELPRRPSIYVQNACVTDKELAPPGCSTLYVLVPVGHQRGHIDWQAEAPRYRRKVLDRLADFGVRDLERRIRVERMLTPADWEAQFAVHRGATFNLAHSLDQMLHLRPRNRFEDLDGVYLVGGGTHPGSGLPVIFEGARITSRLLAQELGLPTPWRNTNKGMAAGIRQALAGGMA
ncbi:phytoene desaturase family protein [Azospirillum picis]|uniref:Phytoene desaturase n=1 Tax=Azospirillum picis TaxID=488438 RepID=A0ABU0MMZ5_9PROT|nr:phytoene desaturase family protein [Azospirillum picis]MBP2301205.1 phytoene desaturase [Azospirillum picis]MDQ0534832.1 phytoene desaturase [Azospirillum picis]